jgi:Nucleotide modification associated domain 2
MTTYYSYVIPRDFGFAPNPFGQYCTLATCKPGIRKMANVGDWIFGTSSIAGNRKPKLIYAMKITEKTNFNSYYNDPRFQRKKTVINGSHKKMYGDNIYHYTEIKDDKKQWMQDDSHHSYAEGKTNYYNLERDTSTSDAVLVSDYFFYLGSGAIDIPEEIQSEFCKIGPGYRKVKENIAKEIIEFIELNCAQGLYGDPTLFTDDFERYNGQT